MANTVHGPYTTTAWSGSTGINITRLDNLETAADIGVHSLNPNLSGPFVHSGIACAKDGTVANQLDIASGVAFVTAADGTTIQIDVAADNTHTTSTPSTTYYLFLLNTGAWQWGTTATGPTNSLPICQVATDGSGNISVVTDVRASTQTLGQPFIVARALHVHVTTTAVQTVLDYTSFVPGLYRVSSYANILNGTSGQHTSWGVTWWDSDNGLVPGSNNFCSTHSNGPLLVFDGLTTTINNGVYSGNPMLIEATSASGHHITVSYTANGGTPSDYISSIVERIS